MTPVPPPSGGPVGAGVPTRGMGVGEGVPGVSTVAVSPAGGAVGEASPAVVGVAAWAVVALGVGVVAGPLVAGGSVPSGALVAGPSVGVVVMRATARPSL